MENRYIFNESSFDNVIGESLTVTTLNATNSTFTNTTVNALTTNNATINNNLTVNNDLTINSDIFTLAVDADSVSGTDGTFDNISAVVATVITLNATDVNISDELTTESIVPNTDSAYDIGSETTRYRTIYADNIDGNFTGSFSGDIIGTQSDTQIAPGVIVNADIDDNAEIADTKLATISTAGKVENSATSGTHLNNANTLVLRDASGLFSATNLELLSSYVHITSTDDATSYTNAGTVIDSGVGIAKQVITNDRFLVPPGTLDRPSYSFSSAVNVGVFRSGGTLAIAATAGGHKFDQLGLTLASAAVGTTDPVILGTPTLRFNDNNILFRAGDDTLDIWTKTVNVAQFNNSGLTINGAVTATSVDADDVNADDANIGTVNADIVNTNTINPNDTTYVAYTGSAHWPKSDTDNAFTRFCINANSNPSASTNSFEVYGGFTSIETVVEVTGTITNDLLVVNAWQSFLVTVDTQVSEIHVISTVTTGSSTTRMHLYVGEGTGGTLIGTSANVITGVITEEYVRYVFSEKLLRANTTYTFEVEFISGNEYFIDYNAGGNIYVNGRFFTDTIDDCLFKIVGRPRTTNATISTDIANNNVVLNPTTSVSLSGKSLTNLSSIVSTQDILLDTPHYYSVIGTAILNSTDVAIILTYETENDHCYQVNTKLITYRTSDGGTTSLFQNQKIKNVAGTLFVSAPANQTTQNEYSVSASVFATGTGVMLSVSMPTADTYHVTGRWEILIT